MRQEVTLAVILALAAILAVFALTIGSWKKMKSMTVIAVFMALAFVVGGLVTSDPGLASIIYGGLGLAFLVYFCFMLGQLVATLKEILVLLQARRWTPLRRFISSKWLGAGVLTGTEIFHDLHLKVMQ